MAQDPAAEVYTRASIRRILGINENRLRSWERTGLAEAKDSYTFSDLISLRTLQSLREQQISAKAIEKALRLLRLRLAADRDSLAQYKIVTKGRRIALEMPDGTVDALTGQMSFKFEADHLPPVSTVSEWRAGARPKREDPGPERLFREAVEADRHGAPAEEVIDSYRKVLDSQPDAAGALANIGTLEYQRGNSDAAEEHYRQALDICPDYALAHYNLGNLYDAAGREEEAEEHYRAALAHDPQYADAHYNLALLEERRERWDEAAEHWQAYLRFDETTGWASIARRQLKRIGELGVHGNGPGSGP